jgi:hypothetical protein
VERIGMEKVEFKPMLTELITVFSDAVVAIHNNDTETALELKKEIANIANKILKETNDLQNRLEILQALINDTLGE